MTSDLGVEALDEEVNQLLQEMQEAPLFILASATNHLESGTSTWCKGELSTLLKAAALCADRSTKNGTRQRAST